MAKHLAQLIEEANHKSTQVQVELGRFTMAIASSQKFSAEQIQTIIELLKPVNDACSAAQAAFSVSDTQE